MKFACYHISQWKIKSALGNIPVWQTNYSVSWKLQRVTRKMLSKITQEFMASTIKTFHLQVSAPLEAKSLPPVTNQRPFGKKEMNLFDPLSS